LRRLGGFLAGAHLGGSLPLQSGELTGESVTDLLFTQGRRLLFRSASGTDLLIVLVLQTLGIVELLLEQLSLFGIVLMSKLLLEGVQLAASSSA